MGQHGSVTAIALGVLVAAAAIGYAVFSYVCPCERSPGGYLIGREASGPVGDWAFANDAKLCQLQVGRWLPHSINLNCMSSGGQLYVSCSQCEGKHWSTVALAYPQGRIRIGDAIYPVSLKRVEDPGLLDEIWQTRGRKIGRDQDQPRPPGWESFHLVSR